MSTTEAASALRRMALLQSLTDAELSELASIAHRRSYGADTTVFRQGDPGRTALFVDRGTLEVWIEAPAHREVLATLRDGAVIGELSLLDPAARSATVVAVEPTVAWEVDHDAFEGLRARTSPAASKLTRELARLVCARIREVNDRIEATAAGFSPPPPIPVEEAWEELGDDDVLELVEEDPTDDAGPDHRPGQATGRY